MTIKHAIYLNKSGIYCFLNKINGKRYIGQAKSLYNRYIKHKNKFSNAPKFESAMKKYGWDNFEFIVLEECDLKVLNEREEYWILFYKTLDPHLGYNLIQRQDAIHPKHSERTKERIRNAMKIAFPNGRAGKLNSFFNRKHSKITKKKISLAKRGMPSNNRTIIVGVKDGIEQKFESMTMAATHVNGYRTQIWNAIKKNIPYKKYMWKYQ